jgi:TetR/AcrR family transcriptional regulator, regulator of cefoperazone and chloramphenicol sensitivity
VSATSPDATEGASPTDTRQQLLEAATLVFAEKGFREATIREICQRAGANVAAVNYHFRDKEGLYEAVLSACRNDHRNPENHLSMDSSVQPAVRLEAYVRWMFRRVLALDREFPLGQILNREMIEPTPALSRVVEVHIRPEARWLGNLMKDLLGPAFSREELSRATMSVVGQILFYKHCSSVIHFLDETLMPRRDDFEAHVRHITEFTLAAAAGLRARREAGTSPTSAPFDSTSPEPFCKSPTPV